MSWGFREQMDYLFCYREVHLLVNLGWIGFDFGCSTLCLVLPGLMENWQNWLVSWARWWTIRNQSQPIRGLPGDGPPCTGLYFFFSTHCGKSYANRHSKTRCERQCTGASFDCTHCDKKFFMKAQLLTHERLHTGEKPFACKFCDSSYPSSSSLKKHVIRHHTS